jgi:putative hydrolase of the HAD superfamily
LPAVPRVEAADARRVGGAGHHGPVIDVVAFDGDDTLWFSESRFNVTQEQYRALMEPFAEADHLDERLYATEMANLRRYGYGAKSFTLSMIETAIDVSDGSVSTAVIRAIIGLGHELLDHPVELLPGAADAVTAAAAVGRVLLITKGDLFHQESKLARSGLGEQFADVEIVSEKNPATYRRLFARHGIDPERFMMVGDSLRSDVEPVLDTGAWAVHVPHEFLWQHERVADDRAGTLSTHPRFRAITALTELRAVLDDLAAT